MLGVAIIHQQRDRGASHHALLASFRLRRHWTGELRRPIHPYRDQAGRGPHDAAEVGQLRIPDEPHRVDR